MQKMTVISSDEALNDRIRIICGKLKNYFTPTFFSNMEDALEFLKYDLPEINILNFSDPLINRNEILNTIRDDPWLHYGGIVIVHKRAETMQVREASRSLNVITNITRGSFVRDFFRLQKILIQNRQILFQRDLQRHLFNSISGSLVMDNDPFNVGTYSNLIPNYLYNIGYIDLEIKDALHAALFEMLMNAVEHGNCNISYKEKSAWLEEHGDILDLIRLKNDDAEIRKRRVHFSYTLTPEQSKYTIQDDGAGFDWKTQMESDIDSMSMHGRGIKMTEHYTKNLRYNEKGNEVCFEITHSAGTGNIVPAIFRNQDTMIFHDGDVVFQEGDMSNHMYYIVSGQLDVYRNEMMVAYLNQDDLFLGEMSFLLSSARSATVRSHGESHLISVSKKDIVNSVQTHPHYGILISRLLASRLNRMNAYTANLKATVMKNNPELMKYLSVLKEDGS